MAFIVEMAGGKALVDLQTRILDVKPEAIHQRTPMIIGSKNMVDKLCEFLNRQS
jgi:fructose-1,6-bisphosphatase I